MSSHAYKRLLLLEYPWLEVTEAKYSIKNRAPSLERWSLKAPVFDDAVRLRILFPYHILLTPFSAPGAGGIISDAKQKQLACPFMIRRVTKNMLDTASVASTALLSRRVHVTHGCVAGEIPIHG